MRQLKRVKELIRLAMDKDPLSRFELLRKIGRRLLPKYRFKWPQMAWWDDPVFNHFLVRFREIDGANADRHWMRYQLMRLTAKVPGDTAECGVYEGAGSYIICRLNQANPSFKRTHFMFDSFAGLSKPVDVDGAHWTEGDLACSTDVVRKNLSEFDDISIHEGWIPHRFSDVEHLKFCFVHIDVDLYQPTLDSIEFFYPRMNEGGVIVCDDYGFTSCPGATQAMDEFLQDKPERMVSLSGGGGFLIKGVATSDPILD